MQRVIEVSLTGHDRPFRLDETAYEALSRYLDSARARISDEQDRDEVVDDLERSIGEKLVVVVGASPGDRVVRAEAMSTVLADVGDIPSASREAPSPAVNHDPRRGRRLFRVREGQQFSGVCTGLSMYSGIGLDWVRTIFVLAAIFTGGIFLIVYLVMSFMIPIVATREDYLAAQPGA